MSKVRPLKGRGAARRIRSLASEERAGSGARRKAAKLQRETLRRQGRRVVPVLGAMFVGVAAVIWFFGGWTREFALGAWTATVIAIGHHFVWQLSGAANYELGALGEQWTAQALRELRAEGWRPIHDVHFERSNIDHLLIGPGGIIVIETKTTTTDWSDRDQRRWISNGVGQAERYARSMRNYLKPYIEGAPVFGVVVLWPDREEMPTREVDGTAIVGGTSLAEFVRTLPTGQLGQSAIDAVCDQLARYVEGRDAYRLETEGPAPRSFDDWNCEFLQLATGLFTGPLLALLALQLKPWLLAYAAIGMIMAGAVLARRRLHRFATLITSASVGCLGIAVWILVATAVEAW